VDSTQTGHGIFLAGHPANFKFLVLVQSTDSPSKVLVNSEDSLDARTFRILSADWSLMIHADRSMCTVRTPLLNLKKNLQY